MLGQRFDVDRPSSTLWEVSGGPNPDPESWLVHLVNLAHRQFLLANAVLPNRIADKKKIKFKVMVWADNQQSS